jgi:transposase
LGSGAHASTRGHALDLGRAARSVSLGSPEPSGALRSDSIRRGLGASERTVSDGLTTEEKEELRRLRREVRELREEKEILKKPPWAQPVKATPTIRSCVRMTQPTPRCWNPYRTARRRPSTY